MNITEIIGYIASVLVAVSLMMSGILRLRIINLAGALFFSVYGFIIGALPVAIVNGFICIVDIYYLWEMLSAKEYFRILELKHDSEYLAYFLGFHRDEIKKYMPSFNYSPGTASTVFFILRNSIPAGLLLAQPAEDGGLFIELDYVIPGYRDMKIGKYVYNNIFAVKPVTKLYTHPGNRRHDDYLKKMGFTTAQYEGREVYCLSK